MRPLSVDSFHTVLFCRKWDVCVNFYRDILGFAVVDEKPGFVEFQVAPGSRFGLLKSPENSALKKNNTSFILSFRVADAKEVHKILSGRCKGVTAVKRHSWGAHVFELRDPEERRLEFWTPL
jgi:catechol 2,3-dioxygenase-like lactoylglutathione lyase family enzyme